MNDVREFELFPDQDIPEPSSAPNAKPDFELPRQLQTPVVGCSLDAERTAALRTWLDAHLPQVSLVDLRSPGSGAGSLGAERLSGFQLLVLDRASIHEYGVLERSFRRKSCPELIVVDLPAHDASSLRNRGFLVVSALREFSAERVGTAVLHALSVLLPLKLLSQRAVGKVDLREAVTLVRFHMLREALRLTRSKRATARLLGVTRPAVQSMVKALSIPEPPDSERG